MVGGVFIGFGLASWLFVAGVLLIAVAMAGPRGGRRRWAFAAAVAWPLVLIGLIAWELALGAWERLPRRTLLQAFDDMVAQDLAESLGPVSADDLKRLRERGL